MWAHLLAKRKWGIRCTVGLKEVETIDQGDNTRPAIVVGKSKAHTIASNQNELLVSILNAPLALLHQVDYKTAKDSSTSRGLSRIANESPRMTLKE